MTDPNPTPEPDPTPFAVWLREQAGGRTHAELTDALAELVKAVQETGKTGSITFTVKVGPFRGQTDTLVFDDRVVKKVPQHDRKTSIWFPDEHGRVARTDPRQSSFDFINSTTEG